MTKTPEDGARYTVYLVPATSDLQQWGNAILGRDAETDQTVTQPLLQTIAAAPFAALTASPRWYGFHGTLKPPFPLAEGRTPADLVDAAGKFAAVESAFECEMAVDEIAGFLALLPARSCTPLKELAASVVQAFEPFRAPLSAEDRARRRPEQLTAQQRANLDKWGYPYVFDEFRFHMTLTGRIRDAAVRAAVKNELAGMFREKVHPIVKIGRIAIFAQQSRQHSFHCRQSFALRGLGSKTHR